MISVEPGSTPTLPSTYAAKPSAAVAADADLATRNISPATVPAADQPTRWAYS